MKFLALLVGLVEFASATSAFAVVNGEPFTGNSRLAALKSVLGIKIRISPCSGTYLGTIEGQAKILTAAHCFLLDGYPDEKTKICLTDGSGAELGCLAPAEYSVSFPAKEKDGPKAPVRGGFPGMGKVIRIPIPDMAMITVKGSEEIQKKFADLTPVTLMTSGGVSETGESWIAGQGCNNFVTYEGREVMRIGRVELEPIKDPLLRFITWTPKSLSSAACAGDSGGALFQWGSQGELQQFGVISYSIQKSDANGLASVRNALGRIDGASASSWLKGVLVR